MLFVIFSYLLIMKKFDKIHNSAKYILFFYWM